MDEYLQEALEIVKAQASVRDMSDDEIISMVERLSKGIKDIGEGGTALAADTSNPPVDPKKAIKEKSVTCLECGKQFKVLTKRHIGQHDMTPAEYKDKWGYSKGTSLVSKSLARERRKKMQDMKLWERKKKKKK
jgi:predicted transcriptional regulator